MKVDIQRSEKTVGLIFKKPRYIVSVTVQFSEEEKALIKKMDVTNHIVIERPPLIGSNSDPNHFHLRVRQLLKGKDEWEFERLDEANSYYTELPGALKTMKEYLASDGNTSKSESFEL